MHARTDAHGKESATPSKATRFLLQCNLRTLLLLTAAVAVWLGYFQYQKRILYREHQIAWMRQLSHELIVDDETKAAAMALPSVWNDVNRWDVYLPEGNYVIRLATRKIRDSGLGMPVKEAPMPSGRHEIELRRFEHEGGTTVSVTVDNHLQMEAEGDFEEAMGWLHSTSLEHHPQHPAKGPLVLYRGRFVGYQADGEPEVPELADGILLWIEATGGESKGMTNEEIQMTKEIRRPE